jgi:D-alanyl-D-alanine carboxypeptidase
MMKTANDNSYQSMKNDKLDAKTEGATRRLQELLQQLVAPKHIHHAVVAIEKLDNSFRWVGAAGNAHPDGTPMTEDTPIWIASVTKLYIASALYKLYERNLIGLDQPMSAYLPQSLIGGLHRLNGVDYTEQITIQHLLGHLSGLPDYLEDRAKGESSLLERLMERDALFTLEDGLELVRHKLTPHFPPQPLTAQRKKIRYSDTNYQLLIAIIEAVTGQPIHQAFKELFYEPLQLRHTFHPGSLDDPEPQAAATWLEQRPLDFPLAMRSAGDLISTVDDMLAFMRCLVQGDLFDQPATLAHMMGNWNSFGFHLNPTQPGWPIQYGQGMMRFYMPRFFSPFRAMPGLIGHTGFCGSWLFYSPELNALTAGTVNQATAAAVPFRSVPKFLQVLAD